ncbi:hypothetical protein Ancab_014733 [Ancistrocladus abbreviatus]
MKDVVVKNDEIEKEIRVGYFSIVNKLKLIERDGKKERDRLLDSKDIPHIKVLLFKRGHFLRRLMQIIRRFFRHLELFASAVILVAGLNAQPYGTGSCSKLQCLPWKFH